MTDRSYSAPSARAVVTVTLEVQVGGGAWGAECTVAQVHKQALDGAYGRLTQLFGQHRDIKILGDMKVTMISHDVNKGD